jgi:hypothetical protein
MEKIIYNLIFLFLFSIISLLVAILIAASQSLPLLRDLEDPSSLIISKS